MKALSVRQPWAGLIVLGLKNIENRTWRARLAPMEIAIHAGRKMDERMAENLDHKRSMNPWERIRVRVLDRVYADGYNDWRAYPAFRTGALVGTTLVAECTRYHASRADADTELWGDEDAIWWRLADARAFVEPEPWRGRLGLFDVPDEIADRAHFGALPREGGGE
jgi:hypothetical protein